MIHITVDCEQWNMPELRGKNVPENNNTTFSKMGNERLLKILKKFNIKATFFVTGYFAEREPEQVKKICSEEHEIASHGYAHNYRLVGSNFNLKKDIQESKDILEEITGSDVPGFRAPQLQFSFKLLEILEEMGFTYDSSLHPVILPGFYNNRKYPLQPYKPYKSLNIIEIPLGVIPYLRQPIGWWWMRNFGVWWTNIGVRLSLKIDISPVIYVHSWEFAEIKSKNVPFHLIRKTGGKFCSEFSKFLDTFKNQNFSTLSNLAEGVF